MVGRYKKTGFPRRKIISLRKLVSDLRPIDILTGEIAIEVTGVVGVSPALWYFRYIASIFFTLHKRLWPTVGGSLRVLRLLPPLKLVALI
jgi:hypothetical protein